MMLIAAVVCFAVLGVFAFRAAQLPVSRSYIPEIVQPLSATESSCASDLRQAFCESATGQRQSLVRDSGALGTTSLAQYRGSNWSTKYRSNLLAQKNRFPHLVTISDPSSKWRIVINDTPLGLRPELNALSADNGSTLLERVLTLQLRSTTPEFEILCAQMLPVGSLRATRFAVRDANSGDYLVTTTFHHESELVDLKLFLPPTTFSAEAAVIHYNEIVDTFQFDQT